MDQLLFIVTMVTFFSFNTIQAQLGIPQFGEGIQITAADSSIYLKIGFRFQTLSTQEWTAYGEGLSKLGDFNSAFYIRRARLKFEGWAISKKLVYKAELALSNRDNGGGDSEEFSNAANIILDAYLEYNFHKSLSIRIGQFKLPGNRERVISSGDLQFVDRSQLNAAYSLDRDAGIMLINKHSFRNVIMKEMLAISSGEGRNITGNNKGGYGYSFRIEVLPFGEFKSDGDYVGSAVAYEEKPRLAIGITYDYNDKAGRTQGQVGNFIPDSGNLKDINSIFIDFMYKHKNLSIMAEYAKRNTNDDDPNVLDNQENVIATYYMGEAINFALGYMLKNNWELAFRWTDNNPQNEVSNKEELYTFGVSKYIAGHNLKIQSDLTYKSIKGANNGLVYRIQTDFHF